MTETALIVALAGLAVFCAMLALELYHELRRAWFFYRTRKHVEQEWRAYYARQEQQDYERLKAQEDRWPRKA